MTRYASNDVPVTDEELGRAVTDNEREDAIKRQAEAFDADDLAYAVALIADRILEDSATEFPWSIGDRIIQDRKATIARRASFELFGRVDVISPSEITC